jgi:hypothetical protein
MIGIRYPGGPEVNAVLSEFEYAMHSGTLSPSAQNCAVTWNFKNE